MWPCHGNSDPATCALALGGYPSCTQPCLSKSSLAIGAPGSLSSWTLASDHRSLSRIFSKKLSFHAISNQWCLSFLPRTFFLRGKEGYWKSGWQSVNGVVISSWSTSFEWSMLFRSWSTNWATSSQRNAVVALRITSCYGPWGALPLLEALWSPRTSPDISMARKRLH